MSIHQVHDRGYRRIFSNKYFFQQLIETFVLQPWVTKLDFARSEKLDKSYVSAQYKETTSDLLYKVPFQKKAQEKLGKDAYICILTEMQSTAPRYMIVRSTQYISNFYADLVEGDEKLKILPPIFPIVLYNGEEDWTAPTCMSEVIQNHDLLGSYGINMQIYLIYEKAYSIEKLEEINNLVSTLFLADAHCQSLEMVVKSLLRLFDTTETFDNIMVLVDWYFKLVDAGRRSKAGVSALLDMCHNKQEIRTMLERVIEEDRQKYQAMGRIEGKAEGRIEGIAEGKAKGEVIGEAKGKLEVAKNMLLEHVDIALIARCTGLTEAEIIQLRDNTHLH